MSTDNLVFDVDIAKKIVDWEASRAGRGVRSSAAAAAVAAGKAVAAAKATKSDYSEEGHVVDPKPAAGRPRRPAAAADSIQTKSSGKNWQKGDLRRDKTSRRKVLRLLRLVGRREGGLGIETV